MAKIKRQRLIGSKVCVRGRIRKQCAIVSKSGKLTFVKNTTPGCGCGHGRTRKARKSRKGR